MTLRSTAAGWGDDLRARTHGTSVARPHLDAHGLPSNRPACDPRGSCRECGLGRGSGHVPDYPVGDRACPGRLDDPDRPRSLPRAHQDLVARPHPRRSRRSGEPRERRDRWRRCQRFGDLHRRRRLGPRVRRPLRYRRAGRSRRGRRSVRHHQHGGLPQLRVRGEREPGRWRRIHPDRRRSIRELRVREQHREPLRRRPHGEHPGDDRVRGLPLRWQPLRPERPRLRVGRRRARERLVAHLRRVHDRWQPGTWLRRWHHRDRPLHRTGILPAVARRDDQQQHARPPTR